MAETPTVMHSDELMRKVLGRLDEVLGSILGRLMMLETQTDANERHLQELAAWLGANVKNLEVATGITSDMMDLAGLLKARMEILGINMWGEQTKKKTSRKGIEM